MCTVELRSVCGGELLKELKKGRKEDGWDGGVKRWEMAWVCSYNGVFIHSKRN